MNPHSERDRLELMEQCTYEAVQTVFGHLSLDHIKNPPRPYFDAKLARQIAIRIMNVDFDAPRRRLCTMQSRQRTSISFAVQAVERRMECEVFRAAYDGMAAQALASFQRQMSDQRGKLHL